MTPHPLHDLLKLKGDIPEVVERKTYIYGGCKIDTMASAMPEGRTFEV